MNKRIVGVVIIIFVSVIILSTIISTNNSESNIQDTGNGINLDVGSGASGNNFSLELTDAVNLAEQP